MKVCFVGGGNMAGALLGGLIARGHAREDLQVIEPDAAQRERLAALFGIAVRTPDGGVPAGTDVVVLAVKPQVMASVAREIAPSVGAALLVSVVAGIRATDLSRWLGGHPRIVRTMPNMPALIGRGITVLAATPELTAADRERAQRIMGAVGETLWVDDEALLDAVTAVSGSGPAYVFYFIEALERAAGELGFAPAQARQLALATFRGAAELASNGTEAPGVLRARVTSRGGTTAAAIAALDERAASDALVAAVHAAWRRSTELGDEFGGAQPSR